MEVTTTDERHGEVEALGRLIEVRHTADEGMFCLKHDLILDENGFHQLALLS